MAAGDISGAVWQIPIDAVEGSTYSAVAIFTRGDEEVSMTKYAFIVGAEAMNESSGGGGSAVVIIVVVVVAAAAAYFFLL